MQSFFAALTSLWLSLFGAPQTAPPQPLPPEPAVVVDSQAQLGLPDTAPASEPPLPVVLGATDDMVTRTEFNAAITALRSELFAVTQAGPVSGAGVSLDFFRLQTDRVYDSVSRSVSGAKESVTDTLTDTIDTTVANYLPLAGGTLTGALTGTDLTLSGTLTANALSVAALSLGSALEVSYLNATSTTATSTFAGGLAVETSGFVYDHQTNRVGIGTANPDVRIGQILDISTSGTDGSGFGGGAFTGWNSSGFGPVLDFKLSRSSSKGTHSVVQSGDLLGDIEFRGSDGTVFRTGAAIAGEVDGTPGSEDMPGRLVFYTVPDGSTTITERMRITSTGNVGIGTTSPAVTLDVANGGGLYSSFEF